MVVIDLNDDSVFLRMDGSDFSSWLKNIDTRDIAGWPTTLKHCDVDDISLLKSNGRFEPRFESQEAGDQINNHIHDGGSVGFVVPKSSWPEWVDFHKSHGAIYEVYPHDTELF